MAGRRRRPGSIGPLAVCGLAVLVQQLQGVGAEDLVLAVGDDAATGARNASSSPTALPTPAPTGLLPHLETETETSGGLGLGTGATVGIVLLMVVLFLLPCAYVARIVCANRDRLPDFGAVGASAKYDERRGQFYGSILAATVLNFLALVCAVLSASTDADVVRIFAFAYVRTNDGDLAVGLLGYVHVSEDVEDSTYYDYKSSMPRESQVDYDYDWTSDCKRAGRAAYGALVPIIVTKAASALFAYKRLDPAADSTVYKWYALVRNCLRRARFVRRRAATILEFFCAILILSMLVEFSIQCLSRLPASGDEIFVPVDDDAAVPDDDLDDFVFTTDDVDNRLPWVSFYFLILAGILSLYVAWVQLRMPTWNAELIYPDYY